MSKETIASNPYITLEYNPERNLLHHTIHQPVNQAPDMFKNALDAGTEALASHGLCKWLSDDRNNGPLSDDILDWALNGWYARTIEAGWKYWANVVPMEVEAAGTLMPVIKHLSTLGLRMQVFTNVDDALAWLDLVPNS